MFNSKLHSKASILSRKMHGACSFTRNHLVQGHTTVETESEKRPAHYGSRTHNLLVTRWVQNRCASNIPRDERKPNIDSPIERRRLPDKVDAVVAGNVGGNAGAGLQLDADVVAVVVRELDHVTHARPGLVQLAGVLQSQLVALHQPQVRVVFGLEKII